LVVVLQVKRSKDEDDGKEDKVVVDEVEDGTSQEPHHPTNHGKEV